MGKLVLRLALLVSLFIPFYFAIAALGVKFGLWDWRFGLGTLMVEWGPRILIASLALGIAAMIAALARRSRRGVAAAAVALAIPAIGLAYGYNLRVQSKQIPPIHDVTTNAEDPPRYSARTMSMRKAAGANPVHPPTTALGAIEAYQAPRFKMQASRTVAELVREAYPELRTLVVRADSPRVFAILEEEARTRGWAIHLNEPHTGSFEATAETFWFGFKDDVVVRVRPGAAPGTLLVDARSTSRVGLSDMGTNAARLKDFLKAVAERLKTGP
jgi:hypothetical protein